MAQQASEKFGLPDTARAVALLAMSALCWFLVRRFHDSGWPGFATSVIVGGFLGVLIGGLAGVHALNSLGTMIGLIGFFEGIQQGWSRFGWTGAILGGPIGFLAGVFIATLPMMLIHFGLILRGVDPSTIHDKTDHEENGSV